MEPVANPGSMQLAAQQNALELLEGMGSRRGLLHVPVGAPVPNAMMFIPEEKGQIGDVFGSFFFFDTPCRSLGWIYSDAEGKYVLKR